MLPKFFAGFLALVVGCTVAMGQQIIAHRGASHDAPENTLAAFRLAWKQGADGIEGDFHLTKDGQIVCLHDADTQRTGDGKNLIVASATLAELRTVDVGLHKGPEFRGESIPTLAELLGIVPAGKQVFLEIKCGREILPPLATELKNARLGAHQIAIISFDSLVIEAARREFPEVRASWLRSLSREEKLGQKQLDLPPILQTLKKIGAAGLGLEASSGSLTTGMVRLLREAGFELHVWTIDERPLAREYQSLGVTSITTNVPDLMRGFLTPTAKAE